MHGLLRHGGAGGTAAWAHGRRCHTRFAGRAGGKTNPRRLTPFTGGMAAHGRGISRSVELGFWEHRSRLLSALCCSIRMLSRCRAPGRLRMPQNPLHLPSGAAGGPRRLEGEWASLPAVTEGVPAMIAATYRPAAMLAAQSARRQAPGRPAMAAAGGRVAPLGSRRRSSGSCPMLSRTHPGCRARASCDSAAARWLHTHRSGEHQAVVSQLAGGGPSMSSRADLPSPHASCLLTACSPPTQMAAAQVLPSVARTILPYSLALAGRVMFSDPPLLPERSPLRATRPPWANRLLLCGALGAQLVGAVEGRLVQGLPLPARYTTMLCHAVRAELPSTAKCLPHFPKQQSMLPPTCCLPPAAGAAVAWLAVLGGAVLCSEYALHVAATAPAAPAWMEATSKAMLGSGLYVKARPGWEHARACMRQLRRIVHRHAPAHCRPPHAWHGCLRQCMA